MKMEAKSIVVQRCLAGCSPAGVLVPDALDSGLDFELTGLELTDSPSANRVHGFFTFIYLRAIEYPKSNCLS